MSPSSKRRYRKPTRLAERPAGALTFAEISSLPAFRGVSTSTLRNWLADGGLGRLPAAERARGAAVYDAAYVAALVARGRPRARARQAEKPRHRTRAGVTEVSYGIDEGWATSAELARRHGLPRSSSLVASVARWNHAVTADRDRVKSLEAALGPDCPELLAMLPLDQRMRIVDGRRCRTYRTAHVARAVAQNWKPSSWHSTHPPTARPWALSSARAHVRVPLPEQALEELVETLAQEADALVSSIWSGTNASAAPLSKRLEAIVQRWCGSDAATSIEARLEERYATDTARSLHGEALRQWSEIASQQTQLKDRDELVVLELIGARRRGIIASGLARPLTQRAIMDLASDCSAKRVREWKSFMANLDPTGSNENGSRVLSLLECAEASRESTSSVRELGAAAIAEAVATCVASTTAAQCLALLLALPSAPGLDRVAHQLLLPVHRRFRRSAAFANQLTALAELALRANREHLLYAVVAIVGGKLRSDRWLDAVALRVWRDAWTVPAWLARDVRGCILRGRAFSAEKAALAWIDGSRKGRSPSWSMVAAQLARVALTDALAGAASTVLRYRRREDGALLREAFGQRAAPKGTHETSLSIALCLDVANDSAASSRSDVCGAATRAIASLLRIADERTRSSVMAAIAHSAALDP